MKLNTGILLLALFMIAAFMAPSSAMVDSRGAYNINLVPRAANATLAPTIDITGWTLDGDDQDLADVTNYEKSADIGIEFDYDVTGSQVNWTYAITETYLDWYGLIFYDVSGWELYCHPVLAMTDDEILALESAIAFEGFVYAEVVITNDTGCFFIGPQVIPAAGTTIEVDDVGKSLVEVRLFAFTKQFYWETHYDDVYEDRMVKTASITLDLGYKADVGDDGIIPFGTLFAILALLSVATIVTVRRKK